MADFGTQTGASAIGPSRAVNSSSEPSTAAEPQATEPGAGDARQGLSGAEAAGRLARYGANTLAAAPRGAVARQLLRLIANPLVVILLISSMISALLGESVGASIIVTVVVLGISINFAQTYRSQRAVERLREEVRTTATVLRDGLWIEISQREIVPGDVIRLSAGDLVPADARLLEARDLHAQEAVLTGESAPVEKEVGPPPSSVGLDADRQANVFAGTSIISGTAVAVVVATGRSTAYGDIAARLAARPPETEFDRGTRRFSYLILQTVVFLVLFIFLANLALRRDPFQSLLFSIALAVGLTPEFLPMIIAVTLTEGAVHMARRKVVVKHLAALQNFGSIDVLCSDKTGTLTSGAMVLDRCLDPLGRPNDRVMLLAYLNSYFETGIRSPLDAAILARREATIGEYHKLDEIPFDFQRRRLSIVVAKDSERLLISKGAPEGILERCSAHEVDGAIHPMNVEARGECDDLYHRLSGEGFRVLAVAFRAVPAQPAYRADEERDLVLAGFLTFWDPPLPDCAEAVHALHRDGVRVKILTGDNELVARHVCGQVGIRVDRVILGDELDGISDAALGHVAEEQSVFARVSPAQKNRVIAALKQRNHVVGFLGDGVNDAPPLRAADVAISVASAVDVAKDTADVVLMDRSLGVLHSGILEGRRAFGNVMKYLLMGTSSNFGNMLSMAVASVFLPFLPMLPMQILLNNFLYDVSQLTIPVDHVDHTFMHKPRRWSIGLIRDFMLCIGPISSVFDFLTFFALLIWFQANEALFQTGWFVESLATQTLVIFVIRTAGSPLRSRPANALIASVTAVVLVGLALPFTPLADDLDFAPLPLAFHFFLLGTVALYLCAVEVAKRWLFARWLKSKAG